MIIIKYRFNGNNMNFNGITDNTIYDPTNPNPITYIYIFTRHSILVIVITNKTLEHMSSRDDVE